MQIPFTREELTQAVFDAIRGNELEECYIRPIVYPRLRHRRHQSAEVAGRGRHRGLVLGALPGRRRHREGRRRLRLDLAARWARRARRRSPRRRPTTSTPSSSRWRRSPTASPKGSRSTSQGYVSEGSGENIFLVQDGQLCTPPVSSSILPGITRNAILRLAEEMGIPTRREAHSARRPLHLRRGLLHRHGGRGHADPFDRPDPGGRRQARPDHAPADGRVPRHHPRRDRRPLRLAHSACRPPVAQVSSKSRTSEEANERQRPAQDRGRTEGFGPAPQGRQPPGPAHRRRAPARCPSSSG